MVLRDDPVRRYVSDWTVGIEDQTERAHAIRALHLAGDDAAARAMLPDERPYDVAIPD